MKGSVATKRLRTTDLEELNKRLQENHKTNVDIVHSLEDQATIISENLHHTSINTEALSELREVLSSLDKEFEKFKQEQELDFEYFDFIIKIEYAFNGIHGQIDSLEQYVNNLSIGFATLFNGRLPPELFSPETFQTVLQTITNRLPDNWAMAIEDHPDNLWKFYQETKVCVAVSAHVNPTYLLGWSLFWTFLKFNAGAPSKCDNSIKNHSLKKNSNQIVFKGVLQGPKVLFYS